jgi:SOS-response transcriptional repressor LexA
MSDGNRPAKLQSDLVALAKAINRRRQQLIAERGDTRRVTTDMSRILEHDPSYQPYRPRRADRKRGPTENPGIFTVKGIATYLDTTVGHLLGEPGYELTIEDRRRLRDLVQFLTRVFRLESPEVAGAAQAEAATEFHFPISEQEFIERDHDYPRDLHALVVPDHAAAAGPAGFEQEFSMTKTQILHSIREIRTGRLQVVRVVGDSMAPVLRNGWKVLVDTTQTTPAPGTMVTVYIRDEGSVLGYWEPRDDGFVLRKANPHFNPVAVPEGSLLWGTVTTIVEAPV